MEAARRWLGLKAGFEDRSRWSEMDKKGCGLGNRDKEKYPLKIPENGTRIFSNTQEHYSLRS